MSQTSHLMKKCQVFLLVTYDFGLEKSDDSEMPCPLCNHTCSFYSARNKKESGLCYHERQDWIRKSGPQVRWATWLKLMSRVPIFAFTTKASGLLPRDKPSLCHLVPRALGHLGNALGTAEAANDDVTSAPHKGGKAALIWSMAEVSNVLWGYSLYLSCFPENKT